MVRKNKKIELAGYEIVVRPMPAREGLEAVVLFSKVLADVVPYLSIMADPSRKVRTLAMLQMIANHGDNLPEVLLDIVERGTGVPLTEIEDKATTTEVLTALAQIIKVNKWYELWHAATQLQVTDNVTMANWFWLRLGDLRTRLR